MSENFKSLWASLSQLIEMHDLKLAKKWLVEKSSALCVVKDGSVIFESFSSGISGFLEAVKELGDEFEDASIADRVAGRAVALLCVYVGAKAIYAITLSKGGKSVFEEYDIYHEWDKLIDNVMDVDGVDVCPFEALASDISDPDEAYVKLEALHRSLSTH